ncbi:LysR family transcriptional regulator [Paraburkholderia silvatlantica]|uniref:LysR family transcriptional regulator n=1 Tax=Paraburkholderia silvatlantica TaxID=321895 RepID=UPI00375105EF
MAMRKISLRHLRCFVAVADTGSFTLAAARLYQTQSSLTATIQQFEEEVGLKLFDRTTRRVVMTADAARFKPVADRVLQDFDTAVGDLQAISLSHRGHARIAAVPSMVEHVLTPALAAFQRSYPDITISVSDGSSDKVERAVLSGEVDFGIASRLNNFPDLAYLPIVGDRFGVLFPADHPLGSIDRPLRWSDLAEFKTISLANDTGIGAFLDAHPALGMHHHASLTDRASSTTSLFAMLTLGGRISVLPELAMQSGPLKKFLFRELTDPVVTREVCLITRQLRSFSPNTQRLVDALIETIPPDYRWEGIRDEHNQAA